MTTEALLQPASFSGDLIRPGDAGYDEARAVFNGMIDRRPRLIGRCRTAEDVAALVVLGREHGLPLSVYGGGHGVTGAAVAEGGICIDMRGMKGITVDAGSGIVRAEAGLTWGEFDAATQEHGLAVTGGRISSTGVAGLALGSGSGWLERKFGFTCDNLVKAEVVTADGRQVIASAEENDDLFWGLRGGGGNFGIVTAFHFQAHRVGPVVLGGMLVFPPQMGRELVRFWRDFMLEAPDEVGSALAFITAPPLDFVPKHVQGTPVIGVVLCYSGPVEEGEKVLAPLRQFGPPPLDLVQPMPYTAIQQLLDAANPKGLQNYWTADFLSELPEEAIGIMVDRGTQPVSPFTQIILFAGGGAISRVPEEATAFGQRTAPFNLHYLSMWPDATDNEKNIAYTREFAAALKPWATGRAYLNFLGEEGQERVISAFGPEKYRRLQQIKDRWDPENIFHNNQNIRPTKQQG
ncbi:MAG TPA: FAD-binding oxidoreductase [Gemmatimonadales bacterium]|nr:FAD-binding oxidoreductase [Gemmatimonadales bacterium]